MDDGTQAPRLPAAGEPALAPAPGPGAVSGPAPAPPAGSGPDAPDGVRIQRGLLAWLLLIALGGLSCVRLGHAEGGVFFAFAGVFILAQASDAAAANDAYRAWIDERRRTARVPLLLFRWAVRAIVPASGALVFGGLAGTAWTAGTDARHVFAIAWCAAAAAISLSLTLRPVADLAARLCFRSGSVSRTRRMAARLVVIGLLIPVPCRVLAPELMDALRSGGANIADAGGLTAQLLGEIALALAAVGWLVRRDGRATLERLGLTGVRPRHALVVLAGVAGAVALNAGMEWIERHALPTLYAGDAEVTRLIAAKLPLAVSLLLGVSAGVGEEITVRGALQPRLGVALSALLFACGHVQYSWFGMLTVGLLGVLLGTIRRRTSTTTAIGVHVVYDVFAALTASNP